MKTVEKTTMKVNGKTLEVALVIECSPSDLSLDDIIGDAENHAELSEKIERGDLMIADITIRATALGFDGFESLGGCYITNPDDVEMYITEHQMRVLAMDHLRDVLKASYEALKPLFEAQGGAR